jgi:hypothetical protein
MMSLERPAPMVGTTGAPMVGQIQSTGYQPYCLCHGAEMVACCALAAVARRNSSQRKTDAESGSCVAAGRGESCVQSAEVKRETGLQSEAKTSKAGLGSQSFVAAGAGKSCGWSKSAMADVAPLPKGPGAAATRTSKVACCAVASGARSSISQNEADVRCGSGVVAGCGESCAQPKPAERGTKSRGRSPFTAMQTAAQETFETKRGKKAGAESGSCVVAGRGESCVQSAAVKEETKGSVALLPAGQGAAAATKAGVSSGSFVAAGAGEKCNQPTPEKRLQKRLQS